MDEAYIFKFGSVEFNENRFELWIDGINVPTEKRPLEILRALLNSPGHLLSREDLLDIIWHDNYVGEGALMNGISRLRKALGNENAKYIVTKPKLGYCFSGNVEKIPLSFNNKSNLKNNFTKDHKNRKLEPLEFNELSIFGGKRYSPEDRPAAEGMHHIFEVSLIRMINNIESINTLTVTHNRIIQKAFSENFDISIKNILKIFPSVISGRIFKSDQDLSNFEITLSSRDPISRYFFLLIRSFLLEFEEKWNEATPLLEQAFELSSDIDLGLEYPANIHTILFQHYINVDLHTEAKNTLYQSFDSGETSEDILIFLLRFEEGISLFKKGKYSDAKNVFLSIYNGQYKQREESEFLILKVAAYLSFLYYRSNKAKAALPFIRDACEIVQARMGDSNPASITLKVLYSWALEYITRTEFT